MRSIDVVLFDFGGVFTASPFNAVDDAAAELGAAPGQMRDIMFGPYHEDSDHSWHRLERGEISLARAQQEIMAEGVRQGLEFDPLQVLFRVGGGGGVRSEWVDCVRDLRRDGYRTALLTNNVAEFRTHWRAMLPVAELFELVIDSSEVGLRKPNPAIYHLALTRLGGVAPERAVFLDDYGANVEAATALGLHGIQVDNDPTPALTTLHHLLQMRGRV